MIEVRSNNTGKVQKVHVNRLVLVQSVSEKEVPVKEDTEYQKAVLLALNLKGKHVYAGTVRPNVKAKRRSLNKRQDQSRKANR